jgi:hypothetical protein
MGESWTEEGLRRELEAIGENKVRSKLATGTWHSDKQLIVEEWLRDQDKRRADNTSAEAKRRANIALVISGLGLLVAFLSLFKKPLGLE